MKAALGIVAPLWKEGRDVSLVELFIDYDVDSRHFNLAIRTQFKAPSTFPANFPLVRQGSQL